MSPDPTARAATTRERYQRLRTALERRQPDLTVLMENVQKPHNFSAVLRTCDAIGVYEAHAVLADGPLPLFTGIAAGADKWVRVHRHQRIDDAAEDLQRRGFRLLAAHPAADATDFREVDFTRPTAVVLGTELYGVSEQAAALADDFLAIPMVGMVTSLNVSVAAALILFEAQRQRLAAGSYEQQRLDADLFERTLFEWLYPRVADLCRRRSAAYPPLGEHGEIVGPVPR